MAMSQAVSESKRAGARTFGVLFQVLAVISFIATLYVTLNIVNLGWQFGVGGPTDLVAWAAFATGLFVSSVLAGIGYTLGVLCAIYDRQESKSLGGSIVLAQSTPGNTELPSPYGPSHMTQHFDSLPASPSTERSADSHSGRKRTLLMWFLGERYNN